jgi:hypothetical protein
MVPYRRSADMPLLPYERQLIEALGCSEAEYREFVQQLERRAYVRPAGYEHVPDVRMLPVSVIVSLVIGVALSAASYLLTPKPKLDSAGSPRQRQLAGVDGARNYSPTFGFDSLQDLAAYGQVVPIAFTRQEINDGVLSGGLLISPAMVWSRMKSFGTFQVLEMIAIAGQGEMDKPDETGIFLGNNALETLYAQFYQLYWNNGSQDASRLYGSNLRYGTLQTPLAPSDSEQAFTAPSPNGAEDTAFSGAFSPSNQARFGVYDGIPNGTPYRPNWEIISVLAQLDDDAAEQAKTNQQKFVDPALFYSHEFGRSGMPGTGRNYARHVGVVSHNGQFLVDPTEAQDGNRQRAWSGNIYASRDVNVGDTIEIYVGYGRQEVTPFDALTRSAAPVQLEDIRSATDSESEQFDVAFSMGAQFLIGRALWQVIERPSPAFNPGGAHVTVKLQCIEGWSANQRKIGLVARKAIAESKALPNTDIPESWYPIVKVDFAHIRNNRSCDVTEIGIKSRVYTQFNGITNFNTVPTPERLKNYNSRDIQVREGKLTAYGHRLSFFALDVRPVDRSSVPASNINDGWENLGPYLFCVMGQTPQEIFSSIRVTHPSRQQFEYRLRPFNSANIAQQGDGSQLVFSINGARPPYQEWTAVTYMGDFKVGGRGEFIEPRNHWTHAEMVSTNRDYTYVVGSQPTAATFIRIFRTSDNFTGGGQNVSAVFQNVTGLNPANYSAGFRTVANNFIYNRDSSQTLTMAVTLRVDQVGGIKRWVIESTAITAYTGTWINGERYTKTARDTSDIQWALEFEAIVPGAWQGSGVNSEPRVWELHSAIAEVSHYSNSISRSCDQGPEHEVVYVNESLAEDAPSYGKCAVVGLKLRSSNGITNLDQLRVYMKRGIEVERLSDNDTDCSNLLTDLLWYLVTNTNTGAGSIINSSLIDREQLAETGRYLRANRLFFDDVLAEPINLRSWLAEKAPSMLCFLSIKNGKLALNPALPYDADGKISATKPAPISALFTDGNIIEGSFELTWLDLEERKSFQAAVQFRREEPNRLPEQRTVVVRYAGAGADLLPLEEFSLRHVTTSRHAQLAAKYFLALRKHVTHTVSFRTLPYGLNLAPGQWIMVAAEESPYDPTNNGIVRPDGTVVSVLPLADGFYDVNYWDRNQTAIARGTLQITGGIAQNLRNTVFSVRNTNITQQVYQVEALDVDQDGIVTIKASNFPVNSNSVSLISVDLLASSTFEVIGGTND